METIPLLMVLASLLFYSVLPFFWFGKHLLRFRMAMAGPISLIAPLFAAAILAVIFAAIAYPFLDVAIVLPGFLKPLGLALIIASFAIDGWSLYLLGRKLDSKTLDPGFVSGGPYAIVRHPIYFCHMAFNLGSFLFTGSPICLIVFGEWLALIIPLADLEDAEAESRLGDAFREYKKKVPQLIPKLQSAGRRV